MPLAAVQTSFMVVEVKARLSSSLTTSLSRSNAALNETGGPALDAEAIASLPIAGSEVQDQMNPFIRQNLDNKDTELRMRYTRGQTIGGQVSEESRERSSWR